MNCPIYQSKCPKCNQSTKMNIEQELIHINCQCGYNNAIMISDYISNTPHSAIKDDSFKDIINELKKGNDHILAYFNTLKNEHITHLMRLAKEIEAMYEDSYKRNKNALTCLQTLIDNYDGTIDMKNKILDNSVNIYQCRDSSNSDAVINYYKNYNIIKTINIKETKTLTEHSDAVYSLLLLNDGRVASCSDDNTIRIYDPSNDYHCDTVIKRHSNRISSICQVDDGTIVSCSRDGTIIIGDYTIYDTPKASINKVITMTNNRIASCSEDRTIKIWKSIKPYSNTPIKV